MTTLDLLARHLQDHALLGKQRLQMSEDSRVFLRSLAKSRQVKSSQTQSHQAQSSQAQSIQTQESKQPEKPQTNQKISSSQASLQSKDETRLPKEVESSKAAEAAQPTSSNSVDWSQAKSLAELKALLQAHPELNSQVTLRDELVFSAGSETASLAFIGEGPGAEEEQQGQPFVGPAGQLLTRIIGAMGLSRESVYISNILKYRPRIEGKGDQGSANRKPTIAEISLFTPLLLRELEILQPKCIIALGGSSHQGLFDQEIAIGRARGQVKRLPQLGIPVVSTYHPSYLLRLQGKAGEKEAKRLVWEDMLLALETAQLPITEKMRGFFGVKNNKLK